jgi:hypothetical protein
MEAIGVLLIGALLLAWNRIRRARELRESRKLLAGPLRSVRRRAHHVAVKGAWRATNGGRS